MIVLTSALLSAPLWKKHPQPMKPAHTRTKPFKGPSASPACLLSGREKPLNVALFLPFRGVNTLSLRHDELHTMTELATSTIALMLTIEVGVAIAFAAAWFTWQEVGEDARSDRQDPAPVSAPLARVDSPILLACRQDLRDIQPLICI